MPFDVENYELDYDEEQPPLAENESSADPQEYGPSLPSHLLDEGAPEDPTQIQCASSSREIGPQIPVEFLKASTSANKLIDESFTLPSIGPSIDSANSSGRRSGPALPDLPPARRNSMELPAEEEEEYEGVRPASLQHTRNSLLPGDENSNFGPAESDEGDGNDNDDEEEEEEGNVYGPAMPTVHAPPSAPRAVGVIGPAMPPTNGAPVSAHNNDEEDEIIGPVMPPTSAENSQDGHDEQYYLRLLQLEEQKASAAGAPRREEWMTELPQTLRQSYGLCAKSSFSASTSGPSTSSAAGRRVWTETPNGNGARRTAASMPVKTVAPIQQRQPLEEESSRESLMDAHQRKRKLRTDENPIGSNGERRPFNRDVDMEVGLSKMTAEEAKNRAGNLVSRFEPSSTKRYL